VEILAGRNSVREALVAGRRHFESVYIAEGVSEQRTIADILLLCSQAGVPVARRPRPEIDRLSGGVTHQGIVARVSDYPYEDVSSILKGASSGPTDPLVLVLDELQDPQNVGALLRTAEAVGVDGVVIATRRAVQITPAVSRASAGAAEHLQIASVANIAQVLQSLREQGLWIVGLEDRPQAQDYRTVDLDRPLALVLGSEGYGLRPLVARQCDYMLRIPMHGRINSLNVSVAGALVLYRILEAREHR